MEQSILHVFFAQAERLGARDALRYKQGGTWRAISWAEYARRVRLAARGLIKLGLQPGQSVAIIGYNRWEWLVVDLATMAAGGVPAPIYQTCTPDQVAYIAGHCEAPIAVAEDAAQLQKFREMSGDLPKLRRFVLMDPATNGAEDVISIEQLMALGEETPASELDERLAALDPKGLATLIYTSGTTGPPKGVMLNHRNLVFTARQSMDVLERRDDDVFLSYLPLSHIAEQVMSIHLPITAGATVCFAESIEKLGENLREVRPTIFLGVPRVWEKIQAKIAEAGAQNTGLKKKIAAWARKVGLEGGYRAQRGQSLPFTYGIADKLVFSKVRDKLGLDRARFCITAAAPIARSTLEFFLSLGIRIYEVYGMSENTGPATMSTPTGWKTGFVGRPMPGTQVKIAPDGEICMKGDHVFLGYLNDPEKTAEALDEEGWLHSGDVGEFDSDGFLKITDRKKDLIITAGGKNVAPQNLEAQIKSIGGVAQAAVIGDQRKYLSALITLDPDAAKREAEACGSSGRNLADLAADPTFIAHLQKGFDRVNAGLARYETIKKFVVIPSEWSVETGELTPTMKLKRKVVGQKYQEEIESMYEQPGQTAAAP